MNWRSHRAGGASPEADEAAVQAARALQDAENLGRRVDQSTADLAETRRRNHFAAAVAASMRGGRA